LNKPFVLNAPTGPARGGVDPGEPDVSIVIAAFNEAGNIALLAQEIIAVMRAVAAIEVICVDDGSTDKTAAEIEAVRWEIPELRLLRHQQRAGQSAALCSGIAAARGRLIVTLDGDGQNDPADIPALLAIALRDGPALVAGIRTTRRDPWSKRAASRLANGLRAAVLRDACPDTGCGLKVFPRAAFLRLPAFDGMHRYLPALFQAYGLPVKLQPVSHRPRLRGQSKYNNLGRALVGILDMFGVLWLSHRTRSPGHVSET
jgi:dolichol-phosphate mannosyltransferase